MISISEKSPAAIHVSRLSAQGRAELKEAVIFASVAEQPHIEDQALANSKAARRATAMRPALPPNDIEHTRAIPLRGIDTGDPNQIYLPTERLDDEWR